MKPPLVVARQGSIEAGGALAYRDCNDGGDPESTRWPPGHVHTGHVAATFQYPADLKYPFPILFNPGGGHTARVYDTTPDGREGWWTLFLREGCAVYGVDRVNTGRAGAEVDAINAARLGRAPASALPAINRYAAESCWTTFRWGPRFGEPFPDTQFPVESAANYYPQLVPTYRDPDEAPKMVAALVALIDKVGPCVLQTWSSSGLLGYLAAAERPDLVKAVLAVESSVSAFGNIPDDALPALARIPILIVIGDRARDRVEASRVFARRLSTHGGRVSVDPLPEAGIFGNGHTLMLERNNDVSMRRVFDWMRREVYGEA